jgi:hypothetical protein
MGPANAKLHHIINEYFDSALMLRFKGRYGAIELLQHVKVVVQNIKPIGRPAISDLMEESIKLIYTCPKNSG